MALGAAGVMIAPPNTLRTDDQIVGYYRQAVEAIGADVPFVIQDYPLTFSVQMTPAVIRRIVDRAAVVRDAQARGLAGAGEDLALRALRARRLDAPHLDPVRQRRPVPRLRDGARRRRREHRLRLPRHAVRRGAAVGASGQRDAAHDLFDAHLPLLRYEQQPGLGLAVRKYVLMRRGILTSAAQRKPAVALSPTARAEVDYLLGRLARHDERARLAPA